MYLINLTDIKNDKQHNLTLNKLHYHLVIIGTMCIKYVKCVSLSCFPMSLDYLWS